MSVPGGGSLTAVAYTTMVDQSRALQTLHGCRGLSGPHAARRYQSGEVDRPGSISKSGDRLVRSVLFEAAAVVLGWIKQPSVLKTWGVRLVQRIGLQKARVAVAQKLAVLLHHLGHRNTASFHARQRVIHADKTGEESVVDKLLVDA